MARLWIASGLAIAVAAGRADAGCPITAEGDAELAARITAELAQFPDDGSPCVAVRAVCARADGGLAIDLQDELGGDALRTFESAAGAAAFLVSWSRRPVVVTGAAAAPVAVAPPVVAPPVAAPPVAVPAPIMVPVPPPPRVAVLVAPPPAMPIVVERRESAPVRAAARAWHAELQASGLVSPVSYFGSVGIAAIRTSGDRQYGIALRETTGHSTWEPGYYWYDPPLRAFLGSQLEGVYRIALMSDWRLRFEVAFGGTLVTRIAETNEADTAAMGLHQGARIAASWPLFHGLRFDASAGAELLWQASDNRYRSPFGDKDLVLYPHAEIGLRWVL